MSALCPLRGDGARILHVVWAFSFLDKESPGNTKFPGVGSRSADVTFHLRLKIEALLYRALSRQLLHQSPLDPPLSDLRILRLSVDPDEAEAEWELRTIPGAFALGPSGPALIPQMGHRDRRRCRCRVASI